MSNTKNRKYWLVLLALFALLLQLGSPVAAYAADSAQTNADAAEINGNLPNPYGGTDYYVDASNGSDSNDGKSADKAWQTFQIVNQTTFLPGDRILLKAGETWNDQQLWPKGSGSEGKPITIDRYGSAEDGKPYIAVNGKVENPVSGTDFKKDKEKVGLTGAVVLRNQQYWEIHNLEISNDDDFNTDINASAKVQSVVRDGISISINADLLEGDDKIMDYFRISDNYIHDIDGPTDWQKIHYGGIVFQVFGEKSYKEYDQGAYYFQDVRIENNHFYKTELHAIEFSFNWFYDRDASSGEYDETGKFHEGWEQLWVKNRDLYSRNVYIGHNYAEDIGQGAIQLANTKDMTVEYNEINGYLQRYHAVSCGLYLWAGADTVMQFNEVYGGPYDEYDGTPWDLEYTNFNVTYQYNYSHDNAAGWMAYMGNSSNSVARYNLSVNENGVLVKNMLSTNYSPTYFMNNVFVYDASQMDWFHDEVFKDTVYFLNNVFYNTSETTPTKWYRKQGALDKAVFSNNAYYEAGGVYSEQQPEDKHAVLGDPQFVKDPADYKKDNGVANIVDSAANFKLKSTSPLIDAGRYNINAGDEDFFGTDLYYGDSIDIGIHESAIGDKVDNPVDDNPIEEEGQHGGVNLALNKNITANYTHPAAGLDAGKLVDGNKATRWASSDPPLTFPIVITIDFGEATTFDEIFLDEYSDGSTNLRIQEFELQKYNEDSKEWETFKTMTEGMGHDVTINDFGSITSSKLQLLITKQKTSEYWTPTMTEIQVYNNGGEEEEKHPTLSVENATYDLNESMRDQARNSVSVDVDPDGDVLETIRYIGTEGNVLSSLTEGEDYTVQNNTYVISPEFLQEREIGQSGLQFEFASENKLRLNLIVVDSTELETALETAQAIESDSSEEYLALQEAIEAAQQTLNKANRTVDGSGNSSIAQAELNEEADKLKEAIELYNDSQSPDPSPNPSPGGPVTSVIQAEVNGKPAAIGTSTASSEGGQTVTRIKLDADKLKQLLENQSGTDPVRISLKVPTDKAVMEWEGAAIEPGLAKSFVFELLTADAAYTVPFGQIDYAGLSKQLGAEVKDMKLQAQVGRALPDKAQLADKAAAEADFAILAPVIEYEITGSYGGKSAQVNAFSSYVNRKIVIPDGVDPEKVSTGVIIEQGGTVRHVATKVEEIDGVNYAVMNSRTNSAYAIISYSPDFTDVSNHWASAAINDMGSRMIINGVGAHQFEPGRDITRAEFAAILIRALGIKSNGAEHPFTDVAADSVFNEYLDAAYSYGIVLGRSDDRFDPEGIVTREQAATMIARAMNIAGMQRQELSEEAQDQLLGKFNDADDIADYAKASLSDSVNAGLLLGQPGGKLAPKDNLTRAEAATLIGRLLQKADLI